MKILHTADWHLGKRLESFSRFQEQIEVLNEICEITERENIDAVIISGDLFAEPLQILLNEQQISENCRNFLR